MIVFGFAPVVYLGLTDAGEWTAVKEKLAVVETEPVAHNLPSDMAQNLWLSSFAFTLCFVLTVIISLATKRTKSDEELKGPSPYSHAETNSHTGLVCAP